MLSVCMCVSVLLFRYICSLEGSSDGASEYTDLKTALERSKVSTHQACSCGAEIIREASLVLTMKSPLLWSERVWVTLYNYYTVELALIFLLKWVQLKECLL